MRCHPIFPRVGAGLVVTARRTVAHLLVAVSAKAVL
jgi:hypothetical protein